MLAINLLETISNMGLWVKAGPEGVRIGPRENLTDDIMASVSQHASSIKLLLICHACGGPVEFDHGGKWLHIWCPAGCKDEWQAIDVRSLRKSGSPYFRRGAQITACLLSWGECPDGHGELCQVSPGQDDWFCPDCGVRVVAGLVQY